MDFFDNMLMDPNRVNSFKGNESIEDTKDAKIAFDYVSLR